MRRILTILFTAMFCQPAAAQLINPSATTALEIAGNADWDVAYATAGTEDRLANDLITWMRLRDGDGVFADFAYLTTQRPDWPGMTRVRANGELTLDNNIDPEILIAWFEDNAPQTGEGAVALANAHIALGDTAAAHAVVKTIWADSRLTNAGQSALLDNFGDVLAPLHAARTDALLWKWRTTDAEKMLPFLAQDKADLAKARIAYIKKLGDAEALESEVAPALAEDAGLAYDRFNWLADTGARTDAIAILRARSVSTAQLGEPFRWSGWRRSLARWEMREGRYQSAYDLAHKHYLADGAAFADLEWLSGYLALTFLSQPSQALVHFKNALTSVDTPISLGRMNYWIARTYEVLANAEIAMLSYREAAQHQTGFYGLLAADKLGISLDEALTGKNEPVDWETAAFMSDDLTQAALLLLKAGERGAAVLFFATLGQTLDAASLSRLGAYLREQDEAFYAVLLGKTALRRGVMVPSIYFPLHDLAEMNLPVSPSLALSIARRESEFNAGVGSPVGALGLMQLMPATAEEVAGILGEPYSRARLTGDWAYNARLGSKYLAMLTEQFGNSPVMIAAGYNAGPSRPATWMDERGDPRLGEMDIVDWIEHIPFRETRNYVMRVTESIPIYEARLSGLTGRVRFKDLLIGIKPILRPKGRPAKLDTTQFEAPVATPSETPQMPSERRPISRPRG